MIRIVPTARKTKGKIDTVIFDLFGTLVPYVGESEFKESLRATATVLNVKAEQLENALCTEERFVDWCTSSKSTIQRIHDVADTLNLGLPKVVLQEAAKTRIQAHLLWLQPLDTSIATLKDLRSLGIRLGLMSVCSGEVSEIWDKTAFCELFNVVALSCEKGLMKSNPEFYNSTLERLRSNASTSMYVGDGLEELERATEVGMTAVRLRSREMTGWNGLVVDNPIEVVTMINEINQE